MPNAKLGRQLLNGLPAVSKTTIIFDTNLKGFGLRVFPSGQHTWILEYRPNGGGRRANKRRLKLGNSCFMTPDEARQQAKSLLGRIANGEDPASDLAKKRRDMCVKDLLDDYMTTQIEPLKKSSTFQLLDIYRNNHVLPTFGTRAINTVTRADIEKLHRSIGRTKQVTANRVVTYLRAAFTYAIEAGYMFKGAINPALGVKRFEEKAKDRYLTEAEFARLGNAIREAETVGIAWPETDLSRPNAKHAPKQKCNRRTVVDQFAVAAIRLLMLTGARLREILNLKWSHVDLGRGLLFLPDSKTGKKTIVLGSTALNVLAALPREGSYVIRGSHFNKPRVDLKRPWALISKHANIEGVRIHDLRHSFASVGAGAGLGLPIIGSLLGQTQTATTERYSHLAVEPLRRGADEISREIARAMGEPNGAARGL